MSITAANLTDGIRVDQATQKWSVNDVIAMVTGKKGSYAIQAFSRIKQQNTDLYQKCERLKINNKGNITPVADAATLNKIAIACLRQSRMSHIVKQQQRKLKEMGLSQEERAKVYVEEETLD